MKEIGTFDHEIKFIARGNMQLQRNHVLVNIVERVSNKMFENIVIQSLR